MGCLLSPNNAADTFLSGSLDVPGTIHGPTQCRSLLFSSKKKNGGMISNCHSGMFERTPRNLKLEPPHILEAGLRGLKPIFQNGIPCIDVMWVQLLWPAICGNAAHGRGFCFVGSETPLSYWESKQPVNDTFQSNQEILQDVK